MSRDIGNGIRAGRAGGFDVGGCRHGRTRIETAKRPRSSCVRFQADLPHECWQAEFTHWRLADGSDVEILCWIDDHASYALSVTAHRRVAGPIGRRSG
jgi:hypothetical protein